MHVTYKPVPPALCFGFEKRRHAKHAAALAQSNAKQRKLCSRAMPATAVALCTLCSTLDLHHSLVPATCGGPEKKAAGVVVWRETVSTNGVSQLMLVDHASAAVFLLSRASDPGAQRGKAARPPQVGRARGGASEAGLGTVLGAKFLRQPGASKNRNHIFIHFNGDWCLSETAAVRLFSRGWLWVWCVGWQERPLAA